MVKNKEKAEETSITERHGKMQHMTLSAMLIALTYIATWLINIRLPFAGTGGLIHLGNVPLFIGALLFGRATGFFAGAVGMGLFDLTSGWGAWAPFTFIICGAMGYAVGLFAEKMPIKNTFANDLVSMILALGIKIIGYYFAEVILTVNWIAPFSSIPGNVIQVCTAIVITCILCPVLRQILRRTPVRSVLV
ncbi:MAG: ECF transporter S component [Eubacterium sp.]|nr:ECF transporter S component [Eubacterium sp.]